MAGKKGHSGAPGQSRPAGPGRMPQRTVLRVGDGVALRWGEGTPMELGEVVEIRRGKPRLTIIKLRSGETVYLMAETPTA